MFKEIFLDIFLIFRVFLSFERGFIPIYYVQALFFELSKIKHLKDWYCNTKSYFRVNNPRTQIFSEIF